MQEVERVIEQGGLIFASHSGGKDSQAMYLFLKKIVPDGQPFVIHADLGKVEWAGVKEHIQETVDEQIHYAEAIYADGTRKNLLDYVEKRGKWPSSAARFCTSDLKRGPINKVIRKIMKEHECTVAINCMGIRAEESPSRAKMVDWKENKRLTNTKRRVYDWFPIFDWTEDQVFESISRSRQTPHWAYSKGMKRLSCCFCVLADEESLKLAAKMNPGLAEEYLQLEKKIGHDFKNRKPLHEILSEFILP
jgi:DNA sulfur modification protein DndC